MKKILIYIMNIDKVMQELILCLNFDSIINLFLIIAKEVF